MMNKIGDAVSELYNKIGDGVTKLYNNISDAMETVEKKSGSISTELLNDAREGAKKIFQPYASEFLNLAEEYMEAGFSRDDAADNAYIEISDRLFEAKDESPENLTAYEEFCKAVTVLLNNGCYEVAEEARTQAKEAKSAPKAAPPQYLTPQQAQELAALQQAYNQQVGAEV